MKNKTQSENRQQEKRRLCACMISKSRWLKLGPCEARSVATGIFRDMRACPFCRMKGRGSWGEITKEDRNYYKLPNVYLSRLQVIALAFRVAVSSFIDTMRTADCLALRVLKEKGGE